METRILWFSRHAMTPAQKDALVEKFKSVEITQINGSPVNVHVPFEAEVNGESKSLPAVKEVIADFDVLAVVAPIGLQEQFLKISNGKPVIIAQTKRELVKSETGQEDEVNFIFDGWKRLSKIEIVMEDF